MSPVFHALLVTACLVQASAGEVPEVGDAKLRQAVAKGLTFLEHENDAWVQKETCLSCHHGPMPLWSELEAARRGVPVNHDALEGWMKWVATYANEKAAPEELDFLAFATTPAELKDAGIIGPAEISRLILSKQQANGAWKATGRFAMNQRRSKVEAQEASTLLSLLALKKLETGEAEASGARTRALAWLAKCAPPESTETLIFQALAAKNDGPSEAAGDLLKQVLAAQHGDGGWAWLRTESQSDAYTTGLAVFAVSTLDPKQAAPAIDRGQRWLLSTQSENGSWPVKSSLISANTGQEYLQAADPIYTNWGTAWAELGLLQALAF